MTFLQHKPCIESALALVISKINAGATATGNHIELIPSIVNQKMVKLCIKVNQNMKKKSGPFLEELFRYTCFLT